MTLVWIVLSALSACGDRAVCGGTGGAWDECATTAQWCVDGEVVEESDAPAICEAGCTCPEDAPVWDPAKGCISEADCGACAEEGC